MRIDADDFAIEPLANLRNQFLLGQTPRPLVEWLQRHEEFDKKGAVRIGAVLTAALLGKDRPHRIVAPDNVADTCYGLYNTFDRDLRQHDPQVPKDARS